jgi:hypothetical protein
MRFALTIYLDPTMLDALPPGEFDAMMRECLAHADDLRRAGRLLDSQMLAGVPAAKTVRSRRGQLTVRDGPFAESKEVLGGFNLVEAADMDEALEMAAAFPWTRVGSVEVRPVQDFDAVRRRVGAPRVATA